MGRQMLSLLAGDAIDLWLVGKLRALTSEHSMARAILSIRAMLWPGGVWFAWANQQREQRTQSQAGATSVPTQDGPKGPDVGQELPWVPTWSPPPAMRADRFLEPSARPLDEDVVRLKALERLLSTCPVAVTTLLGQKNFEKGVTDLHSMLQSSTFTLQVRLQIHTCTVHQGFFCVLR